VEIRGKVIGGRGERVGKNVPHGNRGYDEKGERINRLDERKRRILGRKGDEMDGWGRTREERWFRRSREEGQREG